MKRWFYQYQVDAEKTTFILYICLKKTDLLKGGRMFFWKKYVCIICRFFSEDRQVEPLDGFATFLKEHRIRWNKCMAYFRTVSPLTWMTDAVENGHTSEGIEKTGVLWDHSTGMLKLFHLNILQTTGRDTERERERHVMFKNVVSSQEKNYAAWKEDCNF